MTAGGAMMGNATYTVPGNATATMDTELILEQMKAKMMPPPPEL